MLAIASAVGCSSNKSSASGDSAGTAGAAGSGGMAGTGGMVGTGGMAGAGGIAGAGGSSTAISVQASNSRSAGVAPLSVFFDATATTAAGTKEPFHDLQYTWDFGDGANNVAFKYGAHTGETCSASSNVPGCSNYATGPLAVHLYKQTGTFTPTLTVSDGQATKSYTFPSITVTDPDTVFSGPKTTCVAASTLPVAGSAGCPPGASVIDASTLADPTFEGALAAALANGRRILFKGGDTFAENAGAAINGDSGPGIIGTFGTGRAVVNMADIKDYAVALALNGVTDWRVENLDIESPLTHKQYGIQTHLGTDVTLENVKLGGFLLHAPSGTDTRMLVQDSFMDNGYNPASIPFFCEFSTYCASLGNYIDVASAGNSAHTTRFQDNRYVIFENTTSVGVYPHSGAVVRGCGPIRHGSCESLAPPRARKSDPIPDARQWSVGPGDGALQTRG